MVTMENYEEYMMLDADGELDDAGKQALQAFIAANPALKADLAAWQALKLTPDPAMAYTGKDALMKQEAKRIVLGWNVRTMAAAAAIIFVLVSIPLIWRSRPPEHIASELPTAKKTIDVLLPALQPGPDTAVALVQPRVLRPALIAAHYELSQHPAQVTMAVPDALIANPSEPLPVAAVVAPLQPAALPVSNVAPQELPLPKHESGLPEIHFAEANQQAIKMLRREFDERASQISNAAKTIRETAFAIRIGNKNHYLNF